MRHRGYKLDLPHFGICRLVVFSTTTQVATVSEGVEIYISSPFGHKFNVMFVFVPVCVCVSACILVLGLCYVHWLVTKGTVSVLDTKLLGYGSIWARSLTAQAPNYGWSHFVSYGIVLSLKN